MKSNKLATHGLHTDHTYTTASVLQFSWCHTHSFAMF